MKKYFIIAIAAVVTIYIMSNMSYEQQSIIPLLQTLLVNKPFEQLLRPIEISYWGRIISVDNSGYFYFIEFLIRKGTHFFGYGFVGVIFYGIFRHLRWQLPALFAITTIFIIACLDEYRQMLIPGRTGLFADVLIDTTGAISCIALFACCLLVLRGTTKIKNAKSAD